MDKMKGMIDALDEVKKEHVPLAKYITRADGGNVFAFDLFTMAAINRSLAQINGFVLLIEHRNFPCAAAILRLQLDNLMRVYAGTLVEDPHDFADKVLAGKHVRNLTDRNGKKMTDTHLLKEISCLDSRLEKVYETTSGVIHFSSTHVPLATTLTGETKNDGHFQIRLDGTVASEPEELYFEIIGAFTEITRLFLVQLREWGETKERIAAARQ